MRSRSLPAEHYHHQHLQAPPLSNRSISLEPFLRSHLESLEEGSAAEDPFLSSDKAGKGGLVVTTTTMNQATDRGVADVVILTLRGATYKLFRFHIHDWLAIIALIVLEGVLNIIEPFKRFVGRDMIGDFMYPLKSNTIPFQAVPVIAIVIPLLFFIAYFLYTKDITDLHHATLGLFFAVLITAVITDAVKDAVGRPRPDFYWRCFPDNVPRYDNITGEVLCTGDHAVIKEGHKSFPSGHTSWSFAGLGFLSMYLAGKLQLFNQRGHVGKVAIIFTPLLAALLVGLSRVDDYWHHWQDVFAGAFLGLTMAVLCYHQFFPSIFGLDSMGPYSYLQIGNNFKLACFPWFSRRRPSNVEVYPPQANGDEHDVEDARSDIPAYSRND